MRGTGSKSCKEYKENPSVSLHPKYIAVPETDEEHCIFRSIKCENRLTQQSPPRAAVPDTLPSLSFSCTSISHPLLLYIFILLPDVPRIPYRCSQHREPPLANLHPACASRLVSERSWGKLWGKKACHGQAKMHGLGDLQLSKCYVGQLMGECCRDVCSPVPTPLPCTF